ncbi:bile acid:sodium symporter family protein [Entomobacter blattae]|uniref:Bile acid:sodium symporter n=1 Tax=Entomobacter blattae TaxID=2762277 RepID=A0A7H1NUD0_9PROT|nr:bile acid:sodium symporter family protein [Entomobacter blattae]QNT79390.1 hypothetical protein JGUZn3_21880 [Entomobacter blattae]
MKPDPFLLGLIGAIVLATFLPCEGMGSVVFENLAIVVIAAMFFLQGARLSPGAIWKGMLHWRLHLLILICTFILFPLLGLAFYQALPGLLSPMLWTGIMFLCCLPSTVQSSIAFTSIAKGNIPAAVCAATLSNILGIFITPLLTGLVINKASAISSHQVLSIIFQLLVPFMAGQILQPWIGNWARRNRKLLSFTDRGSILIVVYTAFSHAVTGGLWHKLPLGELAKMSLLDFVLLLCVIVITTFISRILKFEKEDEIAIIFCGSKKTLASGIPMANVLFPPAHVGMIVLPLMVFHQIQLFVCTLIAQHFAKSFTENKNGHKP